MLPHREQESRRKVNGEILPDTSLAGVVCDDEMCLVLVQGTGCDL